MQYKNTRLSLLRNTIKKNNRFHCCFFFIEGLKLLLRPGSAVHHKSVNNPLLFYSIRRLIPIVNLLLTLRIKHSNVCFTTEIDTMFLFLSDFLLWFKTYVSSVKEINIVIKYHWKIIVLTYVVPKDWASDIDFQSFCEWSASKMWHLLRIH